MKNDKQMKQLTAQIMGELSGQTALDVKTALRTLHEDGKNIVPYLLRMLELVDHPTEAGFIDPHYADMYTYHLGGNERLFFQRNTDRTYRHMFGLPKQP